MGIAMLVIFHRDERTLHRRHLDNKARARRGLREVDVRRRGARGRRQGPMGDPYIEELVELVELGNPKEES